MTLTRWLVIPCFPKHSLEAVGIAIPNVLEYVSGKMSMLGGMLKMKIQAMCLVTSSKVAISNVKHKSGKIIGLAHPVRVPTSTPIYSGKCARGQKFPFLNSASNHIM